MSRLPDRVTSVVGRLPDRVTSAVGGLPDQVTSAVGRVTAPVAGRLGGAVRERVTTVRRRDREHEARRTARDLAFGRGYLVSVQDGAPPPPQVEGWVTHRIGGYRFHTRIHLASSPLASGGRLVVLGAPVDVDRGTVRAQEITDRLAAVADAEDGPEAAAAAVVRSAAYLGGRWTLLLPSASDGLTVLTDALATQPVWHTADGRALASHEALLPGSLPLPANSALHTTADGSVSVRRYWPWEGADGQPAEHAGTSGDAGPDPEASAPESVYREFRERLGAHTGLLAGLGRAGVGLTAGHRSRAVLAAYLPHRSEGGYAFTHFATESARRGQGPADDLFAASALAHRLGLPHRVLRAVEPPDDDPFAVAYRASYPEGTDLAAAFARHTLPADTVELHSAGAEVVDLDSWERLDGRYREGDLAHRVMLPFNDRRLLELMLRLSPDQRSEGPPESHPAAEGSPVGRVAAELG